MRRAPIEEPLASAAAWTIRLALVGAGLGVGAIIVAHRAAAAPWAGIGILGAALVSAGFACICAFVSAAAIWRTGQRGTLRALGGLALAAVTLAYPAFLLSTHWQSRMTTQATTDPADPPTLSQSGRALAIRGDVEPKTLARLFGSDAPATPDPLVLDMEAPDAYEAILKIAKTLRWRVVEAVGPRGRARLGHVDAVAYSAVMHLPEDITIRIRPLAGQTRVDVRARSRLGLPDLGESDRLIRTLFDALQDQDDEK